jgi:hypothetical protein
MRQSDRSDVSPLIFSLWAIDMRVCTGMCPIAVSPRRYRAYFGHFGVPCGALWLDGDTVSDCFFLFGVDHDGVRCIAGYFGDRYVSLREIIYWRMGVPASCQASLRFVLPGLDGRVIRHLGCLAHPHANTYCYIHFDPMPLPVLPPVGAVADFR